VPAALSFRDRVRGIPETSDEGDDRPGSKSTPLE